MCLCKGKVTELEQRVPQIINVFSIHQTFRDPSAKIEKSRLCQYSSLLALCGSLTVHSGIFLLLCVSAAYLSYFEGVHLPVQTKSRDGVLGHRFNKRLESFASCYSQSLLLADLKKPYSSTKQENSSLFKNSIM